MAPKAYCPRSIYCEKNEKVCCQGEIGSASILNMVIQVVEFSSWGYKMGKIFAEESTYKEILNF
jgi:hypothetical protein